MLKALYNRCQTLARQASAEVCEQARRDQQDALAQVTTALAAREEEIAALRDELTTGIAKIEPWRLEMTALADRAEDLFDRAAARANRASALKSKAEQAQRQLALAPWGDPGDTEAQRAWLASGGAIGTGPDPE